MNKLTVEFDGDNGAALPDNKSQRYVDDVIANRTTTPYVVIGTGLLLDLFRCAVVEKKIKHTELKFMFEGAIINVDRYGACKKWPEGFGDVSIEALETLLGGNINRN